MRPIFQLWPGIVLGATLSACAPTDESQASYDTDVTDPACRGLAGDREPALVDEDPEHYCREGYKYDQAYMLCVDPYEALGPFPPEMVELCHQCGGIACESREWPANQARRMRGEGVCPLGTEPTPEGLCVDERHAYGPFSAELVDACVAAGGGDYTCKTMRWDRGFAVALAGGTPGGGMMGGPTMVFGAWQYPLPLDHGLRTDGYGGGHFGASRSGNSGGHSGIDILAPVGTELSAVCEGRVRYAAWVHGYGNFVQLICPIPPEVTGGQTLYASIAYAHLDEMSVGTGDEVTTGQKVGTVGKSGNASPSGLNAHLHFEIAIHDSLHGASVEGHASSNHANNPAGDALVEALDTACLAPNGFEPTSGPVRKGRRIDPFLLLSCVTGKPAMTAPPATLQDALEPWSDHYEATMFDVNEGLAP